VVGGKYRGKGRFGRKRQRVYFPSLLQKKGQSRVTLGSFNPMAKNKKKGGTLSKGITPNGSANGFI